MAKPKQRWTSEEEESFKAGVMKYGPGKWKNILTDPQFASSLANRSNIDLKDKWRNMSESGGSGSSSVGNVWMQIVNNLLLSYPDPPRSSVESHKTRAPRYKEMIYEALSSINDPNGTEVDAVVQFLEPKYVVPKNFRRMLTVNLRKLFLNGDLDKVDSRYKIKTMSLSAETSQEEVVLTDDADNFYEEQEGPQNYNDLQVFTQNLREEQVGVHNHNKEQVEPLPTETLEDAARVAAFQVATATQTEDLLIKACAHRDNIAAVLLENMTMLEMANDLYDQCKREGTILLPP